MSIFPLILLALGGVGHMILWVALVNRAHGLGIDRRWVDAATVLCGIMFVAMPIAVAAALVGWALPTIAGTPALVGSAHLTRVTAAAWSYVAGCAVVCVGAAIQRWQWFRHAERQGALLSNHTSLFDAADEAAESLTAPGVPTWLSRLPGNQVLMIHVQAKRLAIPRLTGQHAGLRIVHLSDLHMSGRIKRAFFERVMEEVNRCEPDLVAITGDLVEWDTCLDWIPDTFGRLRAAGGVYYVLGNHDRRVNQVRLKTALAEAGLIYLGGAWQPVTIRETPLILAGNELPWYTPAADLSACPAHDAAGVPLRIVLAHSPDQFGWARSNDVDLILAGHLHGGQVRLPLLGAITSPSLHGVRYASGTFCDGDTVLHVSRGTSSLTPLRWNCPPEIAVLNLCRGGDPPAGRDCSRRHASL